MASVDVSLYNAAGELVRRLAAGQPIYQAVGGLELSADSFAAGDGLSTLLAGGGQWAWDGRNDQSQLVDSGAYYFKVELADAFGGRTSFIREVQVLKVQAAFEVRIFNSAGELVRSLPVAGAAGSAPSGLATALGVAGAGGLSFDLGNGYSAHWDGLDSRGQAAANGSYLAQLVALRPGADKTVASDTVSVLRGEGARLLDQAAAAGTPQGGLRVRVPGPAAARIHGRLYNLAGELLGSAHMDGAGGMLFSPPAGRWPTGVYLVVLEAQAAGGHQERRVIKVGLK